MMDLFSRQGQPENIGSGAFMLFGFARENALLLHDAVMGLWQQSPPRKMMTPHGQMVVEMASCGDYGWISDAAGYRYSAVNPCTGRRWPPMPKIFFDLAQRAAGQCGYDGFTPNSCLVNRYAPKAGMGLHQDRDEGDVTQPIVSVSLGLPAIFLWGGAKRSDPVQKIPLDHGDVVVWGADSRLHYHGIKPIKSGIDPTFGACRVNLTFRYVLPSGQ